MWNDAQIVPEKTSFVDRKVSTSFFSFYYILWKEETFMFSQEIKHGQPTPTSPGKPPHPTPLENLRTLSILITR